MRLERPTEILLEDVADGRLTRDDVALIYYAALSLGADDVDWETVNVAIVERWSVAGLGYIKARAWRYFEDHG